MPEINWYPGHMAKAKRLLIQQIKAVDAIIEICDARAPASTRNPDLVRLANGKQRLIVLNKADLANENITADWIKRYKSMGFLAASVNSNGGKTREVLAMIEQMTKPAVERMKARGVNKTVRAMIVGIPNVGKSTFINRIGKQKIAKVADRPGVTRSNQWIKVGPYLEMLDTPGLLWPRLSDEEGARTLAWLGSIKDIILDQEALAASLLSRLMQMAPKQTTDRFKLADVTGEVPGHELLEAACAGRGWLMSQGRPDTIRAAAIVLDEFRAGKIGRVTLEKPYRGE
ncbi:MAG: ribosome biogenesis GTPase YlqF [Clostridia bacterium]|nr:ribosome biogenesis GTPase YlqF [Clostridia bacterium]